MSNNKPPMMVWLDRHAAGVRTLGFYSPNKECLHVEGNTATFGPYVHLEQFMNEVERRAVKLFGKSFHNATMSECVSQSLKELAKEILPDAD